MTLEEIKTRIKSYHDIADSERVIAKNERGFYYLNGKESAYRTCMDLLDQLEPSWHPYPEESPSKDGEYIVTVPFEGAEQVAYAEFEQGRWLLPTFCYNCLGYADTPIAWMEKPKPHKKEVTND